MSAYDSIRQGLSEALAFTEGQKAGAVVHKVDVPAVDVAAIRASTGCRKAPSPAASASPRARCSTGNTAAAVRPARRKCCSP